MILLRDEPTHFQSLQTDSNYMTHESTSGLEGLGFVTADRMPAKPKDTFRFPGPLGKFLGLQQRFRGQIILEGEKHSLKSELQKQIADAALDLNWRVGMLDFEQGGLESKDTRDSIDRNIKPENRSKFLVAGDLQPTMEAIKSIANQFDMLLIDSGSKVKAYTNEWLDELRVLFPKTYWVVNMQRNSANTTRGGSSAGYNAPTIIYTKRPDKTDYKTVYAVIEKNRGNPETMQMKYITHKREIVERTEND